MQLNFNIDNIRYVELEYIKGGLEVKQQLTFKEENDTNLIIVGSEIDTTNIITPQVVKVSFICNNGLFKTTTTLKNIETIGNNSIFVLDNPKTIDYHQNRENTRVFVAFDCIYTVDTPNGSEAYNATTYDLSASGVSIILQENLITLNEASIVIFMPGGEVKSHIDFTRCERYEEDSFKISFKFNDIAEKDYERIKEFCLSQY